MRGALHLPYDDAVAQHAIAGDAGRSWLCSAAHWTPIADSETASACTPCGGGGGCVADAGGDGVARPARAAARVDRDDREAVAAAFGDA